MFITYKTLSYDAPLPNLEIECALISGYLPLTDPSEAESRRNVARSRVLAQTHILCGYINWVHKPTKNVSAFQNSELETKTVVNAEQRSSAAAVTWQMKCV